MSKGLSKTGISYATHALNFAVGCTHAGSPGCDNCWARELHNMRHEAWYAAMAHNQSLHQQRQDDYNHYADTCPPQYHKPFSEIQIIEDRMCPTYPRKPSIIFVGSQTDLFHEDMQIRPWINVRYAAEAHPEHTFLCLTKRPQYIYGREDSLPNLWLGVTVCNQEEADEKIPLLIERWPGNKWLSVEPMLGPVTFSDAPLRWYRRASWLREIGWVVVGGEHAGKSARPMDTDWARDIRDQCLGANVPFYFKQFSSVGQFPGCHLHERELTNHKQFPASFPAEAVAKLGGSQV